MNAYEALCTVTALTSLTEADRADLAQALLPRAAASGEVIFQAGDPADGAFVLATGTCRLSLQGRAVRTYGAGSLFGEVALIDDRPRTATIVAETDSALFQLTAEAMASLSGDLAAKVYRALGRLLTGYLRDGTTLYAQMDVLLIQDGGCAPGYNPVTASLSEHLEKSGRSVFMTREGFRSLIANRDGDYRALVHDKTLFNALDHVPGVIFSPPLREARGASFRSERFPRFKEPALQRQAAEHLGDLRAD